MTYRRTWFSCVLWFLYTILCVALLAVCGEVWVRYFTGLSGNHLLVSGLFAIPAAAVLYKIVRGIADRAARKHIWKERNARIWGAIALVLIMACGVFIRVMYLNGQLLIAGSEGIINAGGMEFYEMAAVTEQGIVSYIDYGISDLYVMLLSAVLSLLGNNTSSAVYLQVFLQIAALALAYAVTRKISCRLSACISILYLSCSLCCLRMVGCFGPEWLFFVLYLVGMLVTVSFVKGYLANRIRKPLAVAGAAVVGAMIGGLTYLDLTAASLLVVILAAAVGKKAQPEETPVCNSGKTSAAVILTTILVCAAVWFCAVGAAAYVKGTDLTGDIMDKLLMCYHNSYPFTDMEPYFLDIYLIGVLTVPAFFLVFEFFRSGKEQNYMLWILWSLLAAPTPMAVYGEHGFGVLSLFVWTVLAGLGIQNSLFGGQDEVMQTAMEEVNMIGKKAETKTNYIENPLPLPRKHVAREMDYQYEVEDRDMKYDVEVPWNDDFDIQ